MAWPGTHHRSGRWRAAVVLAVALAGPACTSPPPEGIALYNQTGLDLVYVYLTPNPRDEDDAPVSEEYEVMSLSTGVSETFVPIPAEGGCLIAPLVARQADGTEVARLPEGTCWDRVYKWTLDEDDL